MKWPATVVLIGAAGVLQAVLPAPAIAGQTAPPVMASLVVHFALRRSRAEALSLAIACGVVFDSLGRVPLGFSSAAFAAAALLVHRYRDEVFEWRALTHVILGAAAAGGATLITGLLLTAAGHVAFALGWLTLKTAGAAVLAGVTAPLVCAAAQRLEHLIGLDAGGRR